MIRVIVSRGSGDRRSAVISDALITDLASANIRATQELAKCSYITISRTLELPHDPTGDHGITTDYFSYQPLKIFGKHVVVSRNISFTQDAAMDILELEQYRSLE